MRIILPRGQQPEFTLEVMEQGDGWARAAVRKDAGDDPDVTHGALVVVTVRQTGLGFSFKAGEGVGTVTRPGLPISPGEPAINPVPRQMIIDALTEIAVQQGVATNFEVEIAIPGGEEIAKQTWNRRLGIVGGLSILGTTGIVRPFSCAAWIASIHRGIDVARAAGEPHVVGSTGATSEAAAQAYFGLPDHAILDMGDFAGGMLKYLAKHPVERVTIAGGFGKLTKLAQGATDLHSGRSQVDFDLLAEWAGEHCDAVREANTAKEALEISGPELALTIAEKARLMAANLAPDSRIEILVVGREGELLAFANEGGVSAP